MKKKRKSTVSVLPLPNYVKYDKRKRLNKLERGYKEDTLEVLSKLKSIQPVFNRDGYYMVKATKYCWFEYDGKAWETGDSEMFIYKLDLLNIEEKYLNEKIVKSILTLKENGIPLNKKIKNIIRIYSWHNVRLIGDKVDLGEFNFFRNISNMAKFRFHQFCKREKIKPKKHSVIKLPLP